MLLRVRMTFYSTISRLRLCRVLSSLMLAVLCIAQCCCVNLDRVITINDKGGITVVDTFRADEEDIQLWMFQLNEKPLLENFELRRKELRKKAMSLSPDVTKVELQLYNTGEEFSFVVQYEIAKKAKVEIPLLSHSEFNFFINKDGKNFPLANEKLIIEREGRELSVAVVCVQKKFPIEDLPLERSGEKISVSEKDMVTSYKSFAKGKRARCFIKLPSQKRQKIAEANFESAALFFFSEEAKAQKRKELLLWEKSSGGEGIPVEVIVSHCSFLEIKHSYNSSVQLKKIEN